MKLNLKYTLLAVAALAMVGGVVATGVTASGQNELVTRADGDLTSIYTLNGTTIGGTSGYAEASNITQGGIDWSVVGNTQISPWRIGGKNLNKVDRVVYSKDAIPGKVKKIDVVSGTSNLSALHSLTISVYSTAANAADGTNAIATTTATSNIISDTVSFENVDGTWDNCFYRVTYNVSAGSSNKFVELKSIAFSGYDSSSSSATSGSEESSSSTPSGGASFHLVKNASDLVYGATYTLGVSSEEVAIGAFDSTKGYFGKVNVTFSGETLTSAVGMTTFTLGAAEDAYTLFDGNYYVAATAAKKMSLSNTHAKDAGSQITIVEDTSSGFYVSFGSTLGKILYNVNSPRFLNYTSEPNVSMIIARLYRLTDETVSFGAKTWAKNFNDELDPICENKGSIKTAWDGLSTKAAYADLDGFSKDVLAYGKAKAASAGGDEIGEALASYDFCVSYYDLDKFIVDSSTSPVSRAFVSGSFSEAAAKVSFDKTVALIVTMTVVGAAAIGGMVFFSRKRKKA